MLEPFIWMFKTSGIKKHCIYLYSVFIAFFLFTGILVYLLNSLDSFLLFKPYINIIWFICLLLLFLFFQGYFFNLVENIIMRDWDIESTTVYSKKVKTVFKISLPELNIFKIFWRGIASSVAIILLLLPFILLVTTSNAIFVLSKLSSLFVILIYLFLLLFFPALLWNYSTRNSIVAVFNYRKAIYIMGNYTGSYIKNILLGIIYYLIDGWFINIIVNIFAKNRIFFAEHHGINLVYGLILLVIFFTNYIYSLYVNAYLLGTIAPVDES